MGKRISFIFVLCIMLFVIQTNNIYAEVKNVKDCFEENGECEELEKSSDEIVTNDSDTLVGNENIKPTSVILNFIKMIFALLLVLALIYFILMFVKKRNRLFSNVQVLENLGGITVGANKSIQLVRIGNKVYLIGVGDNVEMLQEITDEEVKLSLLEREEEAFQPTSFLQSLLQKNSMNRNKNKDVQESDNFTNTLEMELKKLKDQRNQIMFNNKEKDDRHE